MLSRVEARYWAFFVSKTYYLILIAVRQDCLAPKAEKSPLKRNTWSLTYDPFAFTAAWGVSITGMGSRILLPLLLFGLVLSIRIRSKEPFGRSQGQAAPLVDAAEEPGALVTAGDSATAGAASSSGRRYVVAGLAYGTDYTHFLMRKFIGTLRFAGYKGDIVMGVSADQDEKVLKYYKQRNVTAKVVLPTSSLPLAFIRFYEYKKWIEPYADDDLVLLSDTADTFFQGDPFGSPEVQAMNSGSGVDLMLFAEHLVKLGTQSHNAGWVSGCWGRPSLKKISDQPVLCSGTTLGTKKGVMRYLDEMLKEMEQKRKEKAGCRSAKGIDQGYHNYLQ